MRSMAFVAGMAGMAVLAAAPRAAQRTAAPLTIDQLIDISHPSSPVWSRDGRRIAFTWERAGVANLYVVPSDGSGAVTRPEKPESFSFSTPMAMATSYAPDATA